MTAFYSASGTKHLYTPGYLVAFLIVGDLSLPNMSLALELIHFTPQSLNSIFFLLFSLPPLSLPSPPFFHCISNAHGIFSTLLHAYTLFVSGGID
jgi:hypothetical protein